jgi:hypothetical protein
LHKFFWSEVILISLVSLSLTSTKRLAAILKISSNLTNHLVGFVMFTCAKILISIVWIAFDATEIRCIKQVLVIQYLQNLYECVLATRPQLLCTAPCLHTCRGSAPVFEMSN